MDTLTEAERSERMSRIRSKDTKPEMRVRKLLHRLGYRFRIHRRDLPGAPDIVFPGRQKVLFVHGCFWHAHEGCKVSNIPKSRTSFWQSKFARNKQRDVANGAQLMADGWDVHTIWECETKDEQALARQLGRYLDGPGGRHGQ